MYTQCSKCETVFKLSPETLRAAGGQVRCGRCGDVFNALARLAEDASGFASGESPLELEARADSILESSGVPLQVARVVLKDADKAPPPPQPSGAEIAHLQILDIGVAQDSSVSNDSSDDAAMEFTLPPGELDRIFVERKSRLAKPSQQSMAPGETGGVPSTALPMSGSQPAMPAVPTSSSASTAGAFRVSGLEISDDVRREMLAGVAQAPLEIDDAADLIDAFERRTSDRQSAGQRPLILWSCAAISGAVLLLAQIVHHNRDWLANHGPMSAVISGIYRSFGTPVPGPANLSAYQLRQWGVTGDPAAAGTLRVRASIMNTAPQLEPYPLLRVTLANRFGIRIGSRDFEPAEYLGKTTGKPRVKQLAPGERADVALDILDPGKNAEGFEIDVCLRGLDLRVVCAADAAPQIKK